MAFKKSRSAKKAQHDGSHQQTVSTSANQNAVNPSASNQNAAGQNAASRYSRSAYGSGGDSLPPIDQGAFKAAYTPSANSAGANAATGASAYSRDNPSYSKRRRKAGRGKKIALGIVIAVAIVLVGGGVALANYINGINNALRGNRTAEEITAIDSQLTGTKTFNEPFTVLLVGSDVRLDGSVEGARSDTNIIVRVDPKTRQVSMVSIPRDTMIQLDGYGTSKFNAAYSVNGVAGTIEQAKKLTGVDIDHYAEIDFDGLVDLVDAVGGVDIYVDSDIDDPDAGDVTISEGEQHLDGQAALVYARTRQYVDGDYTRVEHQRTLITAIVNKVLSMPATQLPDVINAASGCVSTDLSVNDILSLAQQLRGGEGDLTIYSATLPSTTATVDGISYVIADTEGIKEMMKVFNEGGDPSTVGLSSNISSEVEAAIVEAGGSSGSYDSGVDVGGGVGGYGSSMDGSSGSSGYSGYSGYTGSAYSSGGSTGSYGYSSGGSGYQGGLYGGSSDAGTSYEPSGGGSGGGGSAASPGAGSGGGGSSNAISNGGSGASAGTGSGAGAGGGAASAPATAA